MGAKPIDVAYVAQLANIRLSDAEVELFQRQIPLVLSYVDKLCETDGEVIELEMGEPVVCNVFRDDVPLPSLDVNCVLANAPAHIGGEIQVPRIVEG